MARRRFRLLVRRDPLAEGAACSRELRNELTYVLDALLADTRFSWELDSDGFWLRTPPGHGAKPVSAQETLRARAAKRAKAR